MYNYRYPNNKEICNLDFLKVIDVHALIIYSIAKKE